MAHLLIRHGNGPNSSPTPATSLHATCSVECLNGRTRGERVEAMQSSQPCHCCSVARSLTVWWPPHGRARENGGQSSRPRSPPLSISFLRSSFSARQPWPSASPSCPLPALAAPQCCPRARADLVPPLAAEARPSQSSYSPTATPSPWSSSRCRPVPPTAKARPP